MDGPLLLTVWVAYVLIYARFRWIRFFCGRVNGFVNVLLLCKIEPCSGMVPQRVFNFFSQFIKSQNIAEHSTAAPCALLAAVFSLLDWHQLTRAGLRSKLVFILSFSTEKLCSDLRHFEITTSNNLFEIMWELWKNKKEWRNDDVRMQGYPRHTDILR